MPIHNYSPLRGQLRELRVDSPALRDNLLGDPSTRSVALYLTPGYDDAGPPAPLLVDLAGFTGSGLRRLAWTAFGESVPQRLDRLHAAGQIGPCVVAFPDCFTALGGNQYINSAALGRWEDFLIADMLPAIESQANVRRGPAGRALFGKSSGGYGALVHGMRHADVWGAIASHSGDVGFDLLYRPDFPKVLGALARYGGSAQRFIEALTDAPKLRGDQFHVLMLLAMAATYDPDPAAYWGIRLPVDPHTCELDPAAWARWLAHDPLQIVTEPAALANLRRLRYLYIDVGARDQYNIHYGARALIRRLEAAQIPHLYEEFDDDHSSIDYRLDRSLPLLYSALTA